MEIFFLKNLEYSESETNMYARTYAWQKNTGSRIDTAAGTMNCQTNFEIENVK